MLVRFRLCFSGKACQSRSTAPQCRSVHMLYFPITVGTNMVEGMGKACQSYRTTIITCTRLRFRYPVWTGRLRKNNNATNGTEVPCYRDFIPVSVSGTGS